MIISEAIKNGSKALSYKSIPNAYLDSEILMAKAINRDRKYILLNSNKKISKENLSFFSKLINERLKRKPIAQLTNQKFFWSSEFYINNHTLIPRPDTELIVRIF